MIASMEAEKKLRGTIYHFQRMKEMYTKDEEKFTFELEAFLVKARSIPDVLLEDFNRKFSLGIGLEEGLKASTFRKKAKELQNSEALDFIRWWENKVQELRKGKLGPILFGKRNISVHRKAIRPDLKKITLYETLYLTESVTTRRYDKNGKLVEERKIPETPSPLAEPKPPQIEWCFKDYPDKNILEVGEEIIKVLKKFIEEAKNRFN